MKTLFTAALLVISFAVQAETITLIGPKLGMGGTEDFFAVQNSASIAPLNITLRPTDGYKNLVLGSVTCTNGLHLGSDTLACNDGSQAMLNLQVTYERTCRAGRCNAHYTLVGGTIERP